MKGVRLTILEMRSFQFNPEESWSEGRGKSNTVFPGGCVSASYSCIWREHLSNLPTTAFNGHDRSGLHYFGIFSYEKNGHVHSVSSLSLKMAKARKYGKLHIFAEISPDFFHQHSTDLWLLQSTKTTV